MRVPPDAATYNGKLLSTGFALYAFVKKAAASVGVKSSVSNAETVPVELEALETVLELEALEAKLELTALEAVELTAPTSLDAADDTEELEALDATLETTLEAAL